MAVGIGISAIPKASYIPLPGYQGVAGFEDDATYWFLFPWFEKVMQQTTQFIDPYGDAVFGKNELPVLLAALGDAQFALAQQPDTWDQEIGWRGQSPVRERACKGEVQEALHRLTEGVKLAMARDHYLVCSGD